MSALLYLLTYLLTYYLFRMTEQTWTLSVRGRKSCQDSFAKCHYTYRFRGPSETRQRAPRMPTKELDVI